MNILVDTHILIWLLTDDERLSDKTKELIFSETNNIYYSVLSLWEIEIKRLKNSKLFSFDAKEIAQYSQDAGYGLLELKVNDVLNLETVTKKGENTSHKDPFDRMLLCQALSNNMVLLTNDTLIQKYSSKDVILN